MYINFWGYLDGFNSQMKTILIAPNSSQAEKFPFLSGYGNDYFSGIYLSTSATGCSMPTDCAKPATNSNCIGMTLGNSWFPDVTLPQVSLGWFFVVAITASETGSPMLYIRASQLFQQAINEAPVYAGVFVECKFNQDYPTITSSPAATGEGSCNQYCTAENFNMTQEMVSNLQSQSLVSQKNAYHEIFGSPQNYTLCTNQQKVNVPPYGEIQLKCQG